MPDTVTTAPGLGACVNAARSEAFTIITPAHAPKMGQINYNSTAKFELPNAVILRNDLILVIARLL